MAKKRKRSSQSYKHAVGAPLGATVQVPRVMVRSYGRRVATKYVPTAQTFKQVALERYRTAVRERYITRLPNRPLRSVGKILQKQPIASAFRKIKQVTAVIRDPSICIKRSIRAEVLHALGKTGSGAPKHKSTYKKDATSKVICK